MLRIMKESEKCPVVKAGGQAVIFRQSLAIELFQNRSWETTFTVK